MKTLLWWIYRSLFPTRAQLLENNRGDLLTAVRRNGGVNAVARNMGIRAQRNGVRTQFWQHFSCILQHKSFSWEQTWFQVFRKLGCILWSTQVLWLKSVGILNYHSVAGSDLGLGLGVKGCFAWRGYSLSFFSLFVCPSPNSVYQRFYYWFTCLIGNSKNIFLLRKLYIWGKQWTDTLVHPLHI